MTDEVKTLTDGQIIALRQVTRAADPAQQWGDTLAFARAVEAEVLRRQAPLIADLIKVATGEIAHDYAGDCPDSFGNHNSRDPDCPACRIIMAAETKE